MLVVTRNGQTEYPQATSNTYGTFDWKYFSTSYAITTPPTSVQLVLGLESVSGTFVFLLFSSVRVFWIEIQAAPRSMIFTWS